MSQTQFNTEEGCSNFIRNMDYRVRQYTVIEDKRLQSGSLLLWKPQNFTNHLQTPEKSLIVTEYYYYYYYYYDNNNNNNNNNNTGIVTRKLRKNLEAVPGKHSIDSLQNTATLGTSHIIRKVLQCEAWSLSSGDQYSLGTWFVSGIYV